MAERLKAEGERLKGEHAPDDGCELAPVVGAIDAEQAEVFSAVCEHAAELVDSAQLLQVCATGVWVAEVPGHEFDFWATGTSPERARKELLKVVAEALQKRLRLKGVVHESHESHE